MKEKRDFKGVWIPKEIWLDKDISIIEKCLLTEISSLDNEKGCFASNNYFSKFFGISERQVRRHIAHLEEVGKIQVLIIGRNKRTIKVGHKCPGGVGHKCPGGVGHKCPHNNTSINNTSINNTINTIAKSQKSDFAGNEVNKLFDIFFEINPMLNWGNKTQRKAAADMIRHFGLEGTIAMARKVISAQGEPYAPVATDPLQMKNKLAQFKVFFDKNNHLKGKNYDE